MMTIKKETINNPHPKVLRKPETLPSANSDTISPYEIT